jgi:hypothetical protein
VYVLAVSYCMELERIDLQTIVRQASGLWYCGTMVHVYPVMD